MRWRRRRQPSVGRSSRPPYLAAGIRQRAGLEGENRIAIQSIEDLGEYKARAELSFRTVVTQLGRIENRIDRLEERAGMKGDPSQ